MSQAGIVDFIGTHPQIPTEFVTDSGIAIPIANILEILGTAVTAHSIPLRTTGSGNTVTIEAQYASAAASSVGTNAGVASFNSAFFTVDANGFVSISGGSILESFTVDAFTAPGTNPVTPNVSGIVTVTGGQVAAGTTANVIRTDSLAANTYTIEIQRSQAVSVSTIGDNGVSHFDSAAFDVDANGFVQLNGGGIATTAFDVQANTAPGTDPVVPTAAGVVTVNGAAVANHSVVLETRSRAANAYNLEIQYATSAAATDATKSGVAHFNSTQFSVDANGFVALAGAGEAIDSIGTQTGTNPIVPTAGGLVTINGAVVAAGTNPVRSNGTGANTMAIEVQISQAVAATDATKIGLSNFDSARFAVDANGFVSINGSGIGETITGNTGGALAPTAGNWNILGTGSITTSGSVSTLTIALTGLTNHAVQVGAGTATLTQVGPSATTGAVLASNGAAADPSFQTIASLGGITTITGNSGGAESPSSGNFNILGTGSITVAGSANTETVQLTGLTNHNVLVGAGTATITNVAPSATSGVPLISQGASSDPAFGTAVVAGGGTGDTSFTAYAVICGGTTTTGALQSIASVGTANQVLTSNGAGALPTFQTISATGAFDQVVVQVFDASGAFTYTPTSGMKYCTVEVVGGGGGSGGCATNGAAAVSCSGGGGGGGYARKTFTAATIGASKTGSVGAGGTAASAGVNTGGTGGTTSLGSTLIQATGGVGGGGGVTTGAGTVAISAGGSGGVGTLGDVNTTGTPGSLGISIGTGLATAAGFGGSSFFGGGGRGTGGTTGVAGTSYGGGASGGNVGQSSSQIAGQAGAVGVVIITEYVSV